MAKKYKLIHDKKNCIGCAACEAVAPDFWAMGNDGKSLIKGAGGKDEMLIEEKDFKANKEAADSCPVNVIHIENVETKEKII